MTNPDQGHKSNPKLKPKPKALKETLPVPSGPLVAHPKQEHSQPNPKFRPDDGAYSAQMMGGGELRGLKGGPETLKAAKSTYLAAEYSGPNDRRPKPGLIKKTDI